MNHHSMEIAIPMKHMVGVRESQNGDGFFSPVLTFPLPHLAAPELACERRRISGCHFSPRKRSDSRKYVCVRRLAAPGFQRINRLDRRFQDGSEVLPHIEAVSELHKNGFGFL